MNILEITIWKKIFLIISVLLLLIMPTISHDFGQNGDEDVEAQYGCDIFNYYANGDQQALDYDTHLQPKYKNNITGMQFYGGMFDFMSEAVHRAIPSWEIMSVRHFFSSIFGAFLMIFTGLLAFRLSKKKWWVAVLSLVFIAFSPRIFGESMNNGKDIPFAMGMTMGIYYLVRILQDFPTKKNLWKEVLLLGLGWGIVFGMRSAGGALFIAYTGLFIILYYLFNKSEFKVIKEKKLLKKGILYLIIAFIVGSILGYLTWPYGMQSPIGHLFSALKEMSNREVGLRVLFEGSNYNSLHMPWYYELKWIFISNPIVILISTVLFVLLIPFSIKKLGLFIIAILLFGALFPLCYIVYKNSTVYDTWRHVFFVYPYWVIMAALAIDVLSTFFKDKLKWIPLTLACLGLLPAMVWTIKAHPNQYMYFNQFVGGPAGAFGYYDLDYYQVTNRQLMNWVLKNAEHPKDGKKLIVRSNMDGTDTYFQHDTSWVDAGYARYYERNQKDWDYYVTYGRFVSPWQLQNGKWPPAHVVYSVMVDGVPAGVVIKRSSKDSYYAYEALQKQDFNTAIEKYAAFLKTDSSDEMVYMNYGIALASAGHIDEGITALKKALTLDASNANFYQILAQIYQAKGDRENAQKSMMQGQSIMAQEQMKIGE